MENIYFPARTQSELGAVLITALLFLLILALLAISISRTSSLEMKMNTNYRDTNFALQQAEINLRKAEKKIGNNPNAIGIAIAACGAVFYRVTVKGRYYSAESVLQSTYVVLKNPNHCRIKSGRLSWRELEPV